MRDFHEFHDSMSLQNLEFNTSDFSQALILFLFILSFYEALLTYFVLQCLPARRGSF